MCNKVPAEKEKKIPFQQVSLSDRLSYTAASNDFGYPKSEILPFCKSTGAAVRVKNIPHKIIHPDHTVGDAIARDQIAYQERVFVVNLRVIDLV